MSTNNLIPRPPLSGHGALARAQAPGHFSPALFNQAYPPAPAASHQSLGHYFWMLKRHWWKCLAFVAASLVAAAVVSSRITPMYESTVTVDVDRQSPADIIGQGAASSGSSDADQFLATQVKMIQSDSVLRKVALQYKLVGPSHEASGQISREDAPVVLPYLKVTRPPNTYLLAISYRAPDPQLAADVANGVSSSYISHTYDIRYRASSNLAAFMEKQLEEIKATRERSTGALAKFERNLNIVNPEEKTSILAARLLQLNAEYTNAQSDRVAKEAAYQSAKSGTLEAAQVSTQGDALKKLAGQLDEAQQKFVEVAAHFGVNHPEYKKAAAQVGEIQSLLQATGTNIALRVAVEFTQAVNREAMLKKAVAQTKTEFDHLNAHAVEYQGLKREAEADRNLYDELVRKIKEAGINAGFQSNAIRIADAARPAQRPVSPNTTLNLSLAFLLSSLVSVLAVVMSDALNNSVRDPEMVAHSLHTEVIGALPRAKDPGLALLRQAGNRLLPAVSNASHINGYDAAIRTLRNSILLGSFEKGLHSIMVTSPAPSEGKSTIALNLALANAQSGHRTLLIDCDLRRPTIHTRVGASAGPSLTDLVHTQAAWRDVVVPHASVPGLDMLLGNSPVCGDAERIGDVLPRILAEAEGCYDLIVVDSPPVLGFPEPLQMAVSVDGVLMVAHAGHTSRKSLGSALNSLTRLRANVLGVVLNEVCSATTENYAYYNHYGKYYKYDRANA